ncbi:hypothetical protein HKX48_005950 [Thoreauomyces humboldtii]|nr:hypothetical protein HKX48_005950 [Thoreauomyces humboldtii]
MAAQAALDLAAKMNTAPPSLTSKTRVMPKGPHSTVSHVGTIPTPVKNNKADPLPMVPPSQYIKERSLTTAERLAQDAHSSLTPSIIGLVDDPEAASKPCQVPVDKPLFQPFPSTVVLQSYQPFTTYEVTINFRNNDKIPRRIKVDEIENPRFTIRGAKNTNLQSGKVAPGMDVTYVVSFTPEANVDYSYNLVCTTEREVFLVPIKATGARAIFDLPDELRFSSCPVNYDTTKTMLVRNIGNRAATFKTAACMPWSLSPKEGSLGAGEAMQFDVKFHPTRSGQFTDRLMMAFDSGECVYMSAYGFADNAHIKLEKPALKMDNTFIGLASMKTMRIFNRSEILADFKWKKFATAAEEDSYRLRREAELTCNEEESKAALLASPGEEDPDLGQAFLSQRFRNEKRNIEQDPLLFDDSVFRIEPAQGTIWPSSSIEVSVFFEPTAAGVQSQTVYCDVAGRDLRLPLQLKGEGNGPKARFSYELLDIEEIFIDTLHTYEVVLENRGDIPISYALDPSTSLFGPKFRFSPDCGELAVGEQHNIQITFHPDVMGDVSEEFVWRLEGGPEPLRICVKGRVVGPSFHFTVPDVNFGKVSYGFESVQQIELVNTSQISMTYRLRIPSIDNGQKPEFSVVPSEGAIGPAGSESLTVTFLPHSVQAYNACIIVDVDSVGSDLARLPIYAESVVPAIKLQNSLLAYGDCYLNYPYDSYVVLENVTDYPARYTLQAQEESARNVFQYTSANREGILEPHSEVQINVQVQIKRLGEIEFPIFLVIRGNEDTPIVMDITANGIGPNVIVSATELNWGKIPVLKHVPMTLLLKNDSLISALFDCTSVSEPSVFAVQPRSGRIPPNGEAELTITAHLDDSLKFTDIVKVATQAGGVHEVHLAARGQGTTITYDNELSRINFSHVFSSRPCSKCFTLFNRGRRPQTLIWSLDDKKTNKETAAYEPVFEVIPARFTLKPGTSQEITVKGFSSKAMEVSENLVCQGFMDKDPTRRQVLTAIVTANFINPLMKMKPATLKFSAAHETDDEYVQLFEELQLKNTSSLPLHISFKSPSAYTVTPRVFEEPLEPGDTATVTVAYDPSYHRDRITKKEHAKLVVSYAEHPQKDVVEIYSEVTFPNLGFETSVIDYGCIANNTDRKTIFGISNNSPLPVYYSWYFQDIEDDQDGSTGGTDQALLRQIFDIRPMRGSLLPGESEMIEATFAGHVCGKFNAVAICDVSGGPKYEVSMRGDVAVVEYQFDRQTVDFGIQPYQDVVEQDVTLINTGRVSFDFSALLLPLSSLQQKVTLSPASGTLAPKSRQKISVRCCIAVPEAIDDSFFVQIAKFEPVRIRVTGRGTFPRIGLNIPRIADDNYEAHVAELKASAGVGKKPKSTTPAVETRVVDAEIEERADSLLLREKTLELLARLNEDTRIKLPPQPKGRFIGSPFLFHKSQQMKASDKKNTLTLSESSLVRLSNYICDFGNVIRNTFKKETVRLKNTGHYPLTLTLDKSMLIGTGFTIEPDKVRSLPAQETAEFTVAFQARNNNGGPEPLEVDLPVKVAGGPTIGIHLRASITVPDLTLSTAELDFGEVLCGTRKTGSVKLQNPYPAPCEWSITTNAQGTSASTKAGVRRKMVRSKLKDFDVVPSSGVLEPGESSILTVRFVPSENKTYDDSILLKINMNSKLSPLRVRGRGILPCIEFEPGKITLGPVLPCSDGITSRFFVVNPSDHPIEMYSVEFDKQYLEEETLLRHFDGYVNGVAYIPPRELGGGLPESVAELAMQKIRAEKTGRDIATAEAAIQSGVGELLESATLGVGAPLTQTKVGRSYAVLPIPQPAPLPATIPVVYEAQSSTSTGEPVLSIILHGPPFSGRRSQARRICKTYSLGYIHLDEAIDAHLKADTSGIKIIEVTHGPPALPVPNRSLQSAAGFAESAEMHGHGPGHNQTAGEQPDGDLGHGEYHDPSETQISIPEDTITEIIKNRLRMDEFARGIVVDGLESKYGSTPLILRALLRALPEKGRRPLVFNLTADALHIRDREANAQRSGVEKDPDLSPLQEVSETDYDNMTEVERDKYDRMIAKHRRLVKEQLNRKKQERRLWEEELALRVNERKAEEERARAKKKRAPVSTRAPEKIEKSAPSPLPRGELTRLRGSSVSVAPLAPERELKTGAISPKLVKRHVLDRPEKGSERARSEAGERQEREPGDDLSSRFTLTEGGELFQNESTYRRVDNYSSTLEAIVAVLREGEKPVANRAVAGAPPADKKSQKNAKLNATAPLEQLPGGGPVAEGEQHLPDEGASRYLVEINANLDEESVFKAMAEHIPSLKLADDGQEAKDGIPDMYTEQIITFPPERVEQPAQLKYFSLSTPALTPEGDEDATAPTEVSIPSTAVSGVGAPIKAESARRSRQIPKVEDAKGVVEVEDETDREENKKSRWIIQPHERKEMTVRFASGEVGKFDQTLNFELVGSRSRYTLHCVGHCQYAAIASDPKRVFARIRRTKDEKAIVHGEYIAATATYEFGPLLNSKSREKYQDRFPENRALMNITNPGKQEIKVGVSLRNDVKSEVFFLEPSTIDLAPGQSEVLSIWAYPKTASHFEDTVLFCVKDNPEPVLFKISCLGVKPELEVDKKAISFDKLLLGKSERREVKFKNNTLLPVAWKLAGAELLGEEFQVSPLEGILEPSQECVVSADFKGTKPVVIKKSLKLEVSDTEKVGGVVQEIPIVVTAEAYDIAVDLHFPKGYEGLDFGVIKVYEEGKQQCTLRNKGKYEVGYRFVFDSKEQGDIFTVAPQQGIIQPSEKPFQVQLVFKSSKELYIKDSMSCKCQFFEPSTSEVTAVLPVRLSARAVFSKFSIMPVRDLNFGALVHGTKATRQFIIENLGEFDFRYSIYKLVAAVMEAKVVGKTRANSRASRAGGRNSPPPVSKVINKREVPTKQGDTLNFGAFTVSPTSGFVAAGQKQPIMVEFHSDTPGSFEEIAAVDITDRSLSEYPDVLEYRLIGESCIPGINTSDFTSIFEEHAVCKRLELFSTRTNYYAEDDRVFTFGPGLAGQQVMARFKLSNPSKVACDVTISTKPRSKTRGDAADFAFDSEPKKLSIPSHESRYVNVTFHPTLLQSYAGIFEAIVDNVADSKTKILSFELRGEGTLPRITVEKPALRSVSGLPWVQFRRLMIGASQTLPIVLRNDGIIPAKLKLDWTAKDSEDFDCAAANVLHTLQPQESKTFDIRCRASGVRKMEAELRIRIVDNTFEDTSVQVSGEGYLDDLSFEYLPGDSENEIQFGDCFINEPKQIPFAITNHSQSFLAIGFEDVPGFAFTPSTFHLRPKSSKEVTASFFAQDPIENQNQGVPVTVRVSKIRYTAQPLDLDWDSNMKTVRWVATDPTQMGAPRKLVDQCPEPVHEVLGAVSTERSLLLKAFADYSSYECDVTEVRFKETLMFQTRVYGVTVRNTGKVHLRYALGFLEGDEHVDADSPDCPFSISPASGSIDAGESVTLTLKFSPIDVGNFSVMLEAAMANLPAGHKPLEINIKGSSLRPFCHFEMEDSDYLARRSTEQGLATGVPAALDSATRVIELQSCGIKIRNTKRFYLMNPTGINYSFEWIHECGDDRVFKCLTPRGFVMSEKKYEMVFDFTPETVDVKESLWRFRVVGHPVSIPFLLVGQATEPNVYMDRPSLNFKSVLVGRQVKELIKLVNSEAIPFSFTFSETSFEMNNQGAPVLRFAPTTGTVPGNAEVSIEITFVPSAEKIFNFNLLCNVRKKPSPLTINVKGEGYEIHDTLQGELPDGTLIELGAGAGARNVMDFGIVQLNEKRLRRIAVVNSGRFNLDFAWKLSGKQGANLSIHPSSGTVPKGEKLFCEVTFLPTVVADLSDVRANCQIMNGSTYHISFVGTGVRPLMRLSKQAHDFGTQFLHKNGMVAPSVNIEVTNDDLSDISLDVIPSESVVFHVKRAVSVLAPGETGGLEIVFQPREAGSFSDTIRLEINGLSTIDINVKGQGTEYRVEAIHPEQRTLHFGAAGIGHTVTKSLKLINRSLIPASFTLGPAFVLENLLAHAVEVSPQGISTLRPKGTMSVDLVFRPQNRIPAFAEDLFLEAAGFSNPLIHITGACQGIEVKLENDTLPFGAVVIKSSAMRRLQLQNYGDIGTKFRWDTSKFAPDFSISPSEGYISPGMEISLEITFHPIEFSADIRYENLLCKIDGIQPLSLTLSGMCVPPPVQNEILKFTIPVRQSESKTIPVTNKSSTHWHVRPIIDNDLWAGHEMIDIEPGQTKAYEITFTPLEMVGLGDAGRHEGSVFFPLPDGSGMLYKLYGIADKPSPAGNITRDVPSKTQYTEVLPVANWLKRPQRLKVIWELAKPDPSVIIKGHEYMDLPALLSKDYKLSFYAFKEGVTSVKVTFRNEATQEFLFYNLTIRSTSAGVMAVHEFNTTVRQSITREIAISNPLPTPVTFTIACTSPDITMPHSLTVQPKTDVALPIDFLPLQARETVSRLTLQCGELGVYQYDLKLIANAAGPERSLHYKVGLGGNQTQTFRFLSFAKAKTEYVCKLDSPDFSVEKTVMAPAATNSGVEVSLDVTYEPSRLGDARTQLVVSSATGGDFVCPLFGHSIAPRPQGPIAIKAGSPSILPFRNVFNSSAAFNFTVDNPSFSVKGSETIGAKKTTQISITYKPFSPASASKDAEKSDKDENSGSGTSRRKDKSDAPTRDISSAAGHPAATTKSQTGPPSKVGKLMISHMESKVQWIFYLKAAS